MQSTSTKLHDSSRKDFRFMWLRGFFRESRREAFKLDHRKVLRSVLVLPAILLLAQQAYAQDAQPGLFGKIWTLTEMDGRHFNSDKPNIEFDGAQKRVSGSGGCNRFSASFGIDGSVIKLSPIISTRMACVDMALQRVETRFLKLLETTVRFELERGTLRLYPATGPVLVFGARVSRRIDDLSGTSWQLAKFESGDGTILRPADKSRYTITLGTTGRVSARIDCNRGGSTWKSESGSDLKFGPLALTRMMCPPGSLHDRLVRDWEAVRTYLIRDGRLFLSLMADSGIYEFEPVALHGPEEAYVSGTVSYPQRIALTRSAVVEVKLVDVSRGARSTTIAEQTIRPGSRQVPIPFDLAYDPQRINPRRRYSVQVRLLDRNRLRFASSDAYLVITGGRPTNVNVIVRPVGR